MLDVCCRTTIIFLTISDNDEHYNQQVDQQKNGNDFEQKCLKF